MFSIAILKQVVLWDIARLSAIITKDTQHILEASFEKGRILVILLAIGGY